MTAEVAIMNSSAVAIAADSATTLGSGKVFYTAEKIFQLHKDLPVGIMIYGSNAFMGEIDWEIIMKEYAKQLNGKPFDNLEKYTENFIDFVKDYRYITAEMEKRYFTYLCNNLFDLIKDALQEATKDNADVDKKQVLLDIIKNGVESYESDKDYDNPDKSVYLKVIKLNEDLIDDMSADILFKEFKNELDEDTCIAIGKYLNKLLIYKIMDFNGGVHSLHSGIVFVGYGEKEIFPILCEFKIYGKLGEKLIHSVVNTEKIEGTCAAGIYPFAQKDVIRLFVRGIDDDFRFGIQQSIRSFAEKAIENTSEENKAELEKMGKEISENIDEYMKSRFRDPMLEIIGSLPPVNLAETAEALINITSLRRHTTTDEETVGGPTDVAIITKGDGFRWFKHKSW
jgi:hypothetical protein